MHPKKRSTPFAGMKLRSFFGPYLFHPDGHERDWKEMCDVPSAALRNVAVVNAAINSSLGDFDLHPTLAKLRVPVLVIEGEKTNVPLDSTREWAKTRSRYVC
jgi:pimeloyl-ACP methyl ester carboxylesterase